MSIASAVSAAPIQIKLKGKTYRISPLTLDDYGELDSWMQGVALAQLSSEAVKALPLEERIPLQASIAASAALVTSYITATDHSDSARLSRQIASSPRGIAMQFWLGVRKTEPTITLNDIEDWFNDPELSDAMLDAITRMTQSDVAVKKKAIKQTTVKKRKKKKRR